jgi:OSK domain
MMGDNFFLNLAVMELGYRLVKRDNTLQSGFCISGLTIERAARMIPNLAPKTVVLLNIGSVDIMQGKELIDLIYGMIHLLKTCERHKVTPILTTLPPLANYRLGDRASVTDNFNLFIMKNPFNYPVIELHKELLQGKSIDFHYFQQIPRHVPGLRSAIVLWNILGRQRIIKTLSKQIGTAVLRLMIETVI